MRPSLLALVLGAAWLVLGNGTASAKPKVARAPSTLAAKPLADTPDKLETLIEVSVLHGTHEQREPDSRIGNMPELSQGPFAKYASYQLLSRSQLKLSRGGKRQLKLPNGRLLEARLEDILADGSSPTRRIFCRCWK